MEWTDTLMLEPAPPTKVTHMRIPREAMEVRVAQGISLICAGNVTHMGMTDALELLRGFRATGRRIVMCDTSRLSAGRQLGQAIVAEGCGTIVISCGTSGREVAIGARDSGLDLANVVVCQDSKAACELLANRLLPGDTVLLLGAEQHACDQLVDLLDRRASESHSAAA
ncbi:hypothetical protein Pr1d_13880 [Bythopirellula goksoeyrii]|uniref:Uncharacterized protein n=2 Tax=Bythopirellula goksoeyrii TaxID=1400387 RepID=A0A5B9QB34_9BACT|nr:hypothetical protein Pr1d_13880 [Bythopirellula goksoeyrii]